jgi:ribonuclease HI
MKVVHGKNIGLKGPLEVHVDGSCLYNNVQDQSMRRMSVGIYDVNADYFQHNLGLKKGGSNNVSEILACFEGLKYASEQGVNKVIIKTDSSVAFSWIKKGKVKNKKINNPELVNDILGRITEIINWFDKVEIELIPREKNMAGIKLEEFLKKHKITI